MTATAIPIEPQDRPRTMGELIQLIEADSELSSTRKRDLCSSIRRVVEGCNRSLRMPADFTTIRNAFRKLKAGDLGVSPKTFSNIKSNLKFALRRYGAQVGRAGPKQLSPHWRLLRQNMGDDIALQRGLCAFVRWCSWQGVEPEAVDDEVAARYHRYLVEESLNRHPNRTYQRTCVLWNRAVAKVPGWPARKLTVPSFRDRVSLPLGDFPASFREDLAKYRRVMGGEDLLADNGPKEPLKSSTLDHHGKQLRRFASALAHAGVSIDSIASLACLVDPETCRRGLDWYLDRLGERRPSLFELMNTLIVVARTYVGLPEPHLEQLETFRSKLRCRQRGMTDKNRDRLRQFLDRRNQARFLCLSDKLLALARKHANPIKAALLVQTALMHDIEIAAPMRLGNLTRLNLDRHIRPLDAGRAGAVHIVIPGEEVKNGQILEFELPPETSALFRLYLRDHRPRLLSGVDDGWLFPGQKGGHKHEVSVSGQLCKAVLRHAGIEINPHLYRHIAAFFYLQGHPGDYETVRRLLGHRSIETTIAFYADFESYSAVRHYNEHILRQRDSLRELGA